MCIGTMEGVSEADEWLEREKKRERRGEMLRRGRKEMAK